MSKDEYEELFGVTSERGSALEILEFWLEQEFWNFNLGWNQFDGHSEGLCILAGVDPERSKKDSFLYFPEFLPSSFQFFGIEDLSGDNQWHLKDAVDCRIDDLKSLGLKGRVHCHEAIKKAADLELPPPWLNAANNDFACASLLPASLRTNDEVRARIRRQASIAAGRARASKNEITMVIRTRGRSEFEKLGESGFSNCLFASSGRPNARCIANQIYQVLWKGEEVPEEHLPKLTALEENVGRWLKEKNRSAKN